MTNFAKLFLLLSLTLGLNISVPAQGHSINNEMDKKNKLKPSSNAVLHVFFFLGSACDSCLPLKEVLHSAETKYGKALKLHEINVDESKNHPLINGIDFSGIPSVYIVDANGRELKVLRGYGEVSEIMQELKNPDYALPAHIVPNKAFLEQIKGKKSNF